MTLRLSIDRFEGDKKEIAVLLADDGTTIDSTQTVSDDGTTQTQGAAT